MRSIIITAVLVTTACAQTVAQDPPETRTVMDSVFSARQVERGERTFAQVCTECHMPAEFSEGYMRSWVGLTVGEFVEFVRTSMPYDNPSALRHRQYVEVVTYILFLNGLPAGPADLSAERLDSIQIVLP